MTTQNVAKSKYNHFVDELEKIPLGQMTKENKHNILIAMHQLISTKVVSRNNQWCQTAAIVERLANRIAREQEYSAELKSIQRNKKEPPRTYNVAIIAWPNANVRGYAEKAQKILSNVMKSSSKSTPWPF